MAIDISVIIPAYNIEKYIVDCLDSVSKQSGGFVTECIIVDDNSTDSTLAVVNDYIANYQGLIDFKVLKHEVNQGQGVARNTALDVARGEYIFFLDGDDVIPSHSFNKLMELVKRYPGVDVVWGPFEHNPRNIALEELYGISKFKGTEYIDSIEELKLRFFDIPKRIWAALLRREMLEDNNIRFLGDVKVEDLHFSLRLYEGVHSMAFCHENVYLYRYRQDSTTDKMKDEQSFDYRLTIFEELANRYDTFDVYYAKYLGNTLLDMYFELRRLNLDKKYVKRYNKVVGTVCKRIPERWRLALAYLKFPRPFMRVRLFWLLTKILLK